MRNFFTESEKERFRKINQKWHFVDNKILEKQDIQLPKTIVRRRLNKNNTTGRKERGEVG